VIEAASGGGLQVLTTSGAATSPDEQLLTPPTGSASREGRSVAVGAGGLVSGTGVAVGVGAVQALASMDSTTSIAIRNHNLRILRFSLLPIVMRPGLPPQSPQPFLYHIQVRGRKGPGAQQLEPQRVLWVQCTQCIQVFQGEALFS